MNKCGPLAQLVEQFPFKEWVDGSSPSGLTKNILFNVLRNDFTLKILACYNRWVIKNNFIHFLV